MTDWTNECPNHTKHEACLQRAKADIEKINFDRNEDTLSMKNTHKDMWDSIKDKVPMSLFYWVVAGVFVAMLFLFVTNQEAISEVKQENKCTATTVIRIEKKLDRIAMSMRLKNWDAFEVKE